MREIKFKAWSKIGAKMSPPVTMKQWCYAQYDTTLDPLDDSLVIFLQFTGLKDKKGKEIYEGDILVYRKLITEFSYKDKTGRYHSKKRTKPKEELHYWQVFWNERHGWMIRRVEATNSLWKAIENHEVIGNIYENPDLLSV